MKPLGRRELQAALPPRRPDDHKGTFGHVLLVAGSQGMAGAAILSARAALRSGAGLVTAAVPFSLQPAVAGAVPEAMTLGLAETSSGSLRAEAMARLRTVLKDKRITILAIGPGLSTNPETAKLVVHALSALPVPAVVDADGLNLLASLDGASVRQLLRERGAPTILTPHPGEMARLQKSDAAEVQRDRAGAAVRLARDCRVVAVLKGHRTVITDGERAVLNRTGGPGLARGGTGDVLTGIIAGLWAQMEASGRVEGQRAFKAAALGCHLHGLAGDLAARGLTPWAMTAGDVVEFLPQAFRKL